MEEMSTTIRISRDDKLRLERLAKRTSSKTLTEAFRFALESAEKENERFRGNTVALVETLRFAGPSSKKKVSVSENVDDELGKFISQERS